jgi:Lon protease-like protein
VKFLVSLSHCYTKNDEGAVVTPTLQTIPLFPLDVVLFPQMVLPLHIFETRYRQMVKDCVQSGGPFGLVWTEGEPVAIDPKRPLIGTKAMLTEVTPLSDGRYNINTLGSERFLVRRLSYENLYLTGHIEPFPAIDALTPAAYARMNTLLPLLHHYLSLLSQAADQEITLEEAPEDPSALAFIVAVLYQGQNWRKQELLSIQSIPLLLQKEIDLLSVENPIIEDMLMQKARGKISPLISGSLAMYGVN